MLADLVIADDGAPPHVSMLDTAERLPWAGTRGHAIAEIYGLIKQYRTGWSS